MQVLAGKRSPTRKWDITTTVRDFVWLALIIVLPTVFEASTEPKVRQDLGLTVLDTRLLLLTRLDIVTTGLDL